MDTSKIVKCSKCGKDYKMEIIIFPCKLEDPRYRETYYSCPYCGHSVDILLSSNEDVKTSKSDK